MRRHVLPWVKRFIVLVLVVGAALGGLVPAANALTEDQQIVADAWRLVDRAYVDHTFNHQNWWQVRQDALKQPLASREDAYQAIQTMVASLGDPFTRFLAPEQYRNLQTSTSGALTGVGLQIALDAETGVLKVIAPIAGAPAAQAGIQPADLILKIDGVPTAGLSLDEAAAKMRGPVGSRVTLTVQHSDAPPSDLEVRRDRITLNPVSAELRIASAPIKTTSVSAKSDPDRKIGYIRLSQFNANATTEVRHAIDDLSQQGAEAYILDLRNNPGGLLHAGIEIAQLWLDQGVIVYTVNRQRVQDSFDAIGEALTDAPLVVLVNRGTASASEILAGALQDNGRAKIIGERTFGKGLIQSLFDLSDGSGLAVTVAKYETPAHHDINQQGITPDVTVASDPISLTEMGTRVDRQYQAAVDLLNPQPMVAGAA